ncbi:MAG: hypothetical protein AAFS10_10405, partial [Myxococcota bacterium]
MSRPVSSKPISSRWVLEVPLVVVSVRSSWFSAVLLLWTGCQDDVYVDSDTQMGNTTAENQDD